MKKIDITSLRNLITLGAIVFVNFTYGKTYIAINSGKWSDPKTWETEAPGANISANDEVIIKNHITMNTDVSVNGTLTIVKGISMMSNKTLVINTDGKLVNNGNLTVKRLVNDGTIYNNSMMEAMNDIDNKGTLNNNSNMLAGNDIRNMGGNVTGSSGTYFANGDVVASPDARFGVNVKIYNSPSQPQYTASNMSLDAQEVNGHVMLTVNNPGGEPIRKLTIEKSYNGTSYEVVSEVTPANSSVAMVYQDKNVEQETVHYKVKINDANYLPQATVRMALTSASLR